MGRTPDGNHRFWVRTYIARSYMYWYFREQRLMTVEGCPTLSPEDGLLTTKLVHLALPVRWTLIGQEGRSAAEMACTYDIHPHGARLLSSAGLNVGDLVMVERGRHKAVCQVVWSADPVSPLRGQFTVQCVEGRTPWDEELRQMEEQFQPVIIDGLERRTSSSRVGRMLTGAGALASMWRVRRR